MSDMLSYMMMMLDGCSWQVLLTGAGLGISIALYLCSGTVEYLVLFGTAMVFAMTFLK